MMAVCPMYKYNANRFNNSYYLTSSVHLNDGEFLDVIRFTCRILYFTSNIYIGDLGCNKSPRSPPSYLWGGSIGNTQSVSHTH